MKKFALLASLIVSLSALPALAADMAPRMVTKAPMVAPISTNWTGCYIGGNAGGAWSNDSYMFTNNLGTVENFGFSPRSGIYGGQVGCQYQAGNVVFGVEGTYSGTRLNQTDAAVLVVPAVRSFKVDQIATVVGKLGFTWDRWMFYGKGGFADMRVNTSSFNPATGLAAGSTAWNSGFTVGAGFEYMVIPSLVLGVEYDYYRANFSSTAVVTPAGNGVSTFSNGTAEVHAVTARASWLFNWGGPVVARY